MARAGEFRNLITIQQASYTTSDVGTRRASWSSVATNVPAEVRNRGLGERTEINQTVAVVETLFRIRKPQAWTPVPKDMRILFNSIYYYITRVEDWNYPDRVDMWAERRDNQQ